MTERRNSTKTILGLALLGAAVGCTAYFLGRRNRASSHKLPTAPAPNIPSTPQAVEHHLDPSQSHRRRLWWHIGEILVAFGLLKEAVIALLSEPPFSGALLAFYFGCQLMVIKVGID